MIYYLVNSNYPAKVYGPFANSILAWRYLFGRDYQPDEINAYVNVGWFIGMQDTERHNELVRELIGS